MSPQTHLVFCLLRCRTVKTTSSPSSTCIYGRTTYAWTYAWMVCQNLAKTFQVRDLLLLFDVYFCYVFMFITFLIDTSSWLQDSVTQCGSQPWNLQWRTQSKSPQTHLAFHLLYCYAAKTTSSQSSMCIYRRRTYVWMVRQNLTQYQRTSQKKEHGTLRLHLCPLQW
jgi:hypothetical protein